MHRHGYSGRKLSRDTDQRKALIRGQVTSLVLHERITTTDAKAKEIAPVMDRLVTKAKRGGLHNLRALRTVLLTENAARKLTEEIAPAMSERAGGYTRIIKLGNRRGDNAAQSMIELVLPEKIVPKKTGDQAKAGEAEVAEESTEKPTTKPKATTRKKTAAKEAK